MTRLMHDAMGVGLAANQVGILRRVLVLQTDGEGSLVCSSIRRSSTVRTRRKRTPRAASLQGVVVPVERALRLRVGARDAQGAAVELELEGLAARVAQHEVDHLDGVLIVDRTTPEGRREALAVLRQAAAL